MEAISGVAFWMDSQQYASLSETEKEKVSAAVKTYEDEVADADLVYDKAVAAAKKKLTDEIAKITQGPLSKND